MTSFFPKICNVCVEYEGRRIASLSSPTGLNPAVAMQKSLPSNRKVNTKSIFDYYFSHKGGCGGWPSTKNGGYVSGFSNYNREELRRGSLGVTHERR